MNAKAALRDSAESAEAVASLSDKHRTTIISTTAHTVRRFIKGEIANSSVLEEVFDVLVLDESSQIPVILALKPLAALREGAQLVVAGDHMQMPPIQSLDPPKGAEHLVDSIQTYLIKRFGLDHQPLLVNYRRTRT